MIAPTPGSALPTVPRTSNGARLRFARFTIRPPLIMLEDALRAVAKDASSEVNLSMLQSSAMIFASHCRKKGDRLAQVIDRVEALCRLTFSSKAQCDLLCGQVVKWTGDAYR